MNGLRRGPPLRGDMTLEEITKMAAESFLEGEEIGLLQAGVVVDENRKLVLTVAISVEEVAEWPPMLPGSGGVTRQ